MNLPTWMRRLVGAGRIIGTGDLSPSHATFKSKIGRKYNGLSFDQAVIRWTRLLRDAWDQQDHSDVDDSVEQSIEVGTSDTLFVDVNLLLISKETGEIEYEATPYRIERCSGDVWCMTGRRAKLVSNIYGEL